MTDAAVVYHDYLLSAHWQAVRRRALHRAGWKCQVCGGRSRLEVHHNSYENMFQEDDTDVVVLCHNCHDLFTHYVGKR